jgi:hypothetical protein
MFHCREIGPQFGIDRPKSWKNKEFSLKKPALAPQCLMEREGV